MKYGVSCPWITYHALIDAIAGHWKFFLQTPDLIDCRVAKYHEIQGRKSLSKWVYCKGVRTDVHRRKCMEIWSKKLEMTSVNAEDFKNLFNNIYRITNVVKLRSFQYRLLHNKIFCNDQLVHWRKVTSNVCNFCKNEKQTIQHLLFYCVVSRNIWSKLENLVSVTEENLEFNIETIIFNRVCENKLHIINLLVLVTKKYLYRCKCSGMTPNWQELLNEFYLTYRIEIYIGTEKGKWSYTKRKWALTITLLKY